MYLSIDPVLFSYLAIRWSGRKIPQSTIYALPFGKHISRSYFLRVYQWAQL